MRKELQEETAKEVMHNMMSEFSQELDMKLKEE